jgi:hypothetical protein
MGENEILDNLENITISYCVSFHDADPLSDVAVFIFFLLFSTDSGQRIFSPCAQDLYSAPLTSLVYIYIYSEGTVMAYFLCSEPHIEPIKGSFLFNC